MIRATTPIHAFRFDNDPEITYKTILITYSQGNSVILEKHKEDLTVEQIIPDPNASCQLEGWRAWYRLTQEETNKFSADIGKPVYVQVRVLTYEGEALASDRKLLQLQDVLNDEVLV